MALKTLSPELTALLHPQVNSFQQEFNTAGLLITTYEDGNQRTERTSNPYYTHRINMRLKLNKTELKDFMDYGKNELDDFKKPFLWGFTKSVSLRFDEARFVIGGANNINVSSTSGNRVFDVSFTLLAKETDLDTRIPDDIIDLLCNVSSFENLREILQRMLVAIPSIILVKSAFGG